MVRSSPGSSGTRSVDRRKGEDTFASLIEIQSRNGILRFDGEVLEMFGWGQVRSTRLHVLQITEVELKQGEGVSLHLVLHVAGWRRGPPTPQALLFETSHRDELEELRAALRDSSSRLRSRA